MSSSTTVHKLYLTFCAVQWYSVYVMLGVACQCHIRDFFHVHIAAASSSSALCSLPLLWSAGCLTPNFWGANCVCVSVLAHNRKDMQYMVDSQGLPPLLPCLTPPHGNTPHALSVPFSSVLRRRPGEEHQLPPSWHRTLEGKLPACQMRGNFFDCVMSSISQMGGLELHSLAQ